MKQKVPRELTEIVLEIHKSTESSTEKEKQSITSKSFIVFFVETLPGGSAKIKSDLMKPDTLIGNLWLRPLLCSLVSTISHQHKDGVHI